MQTATAASEELEAKEREEQIRTAAKQTRELLIDTQSKSYDRAAAYMNLVMFGGYAGAFSIWNFTRDLLGSRSEAWIALLLTVSLVAFIAFEVFKMIFVSKTLFRQNTLLSKHLQPHEFLAEMEELARQDNERVSKVLPIWICALAISAGTAIGAAGIGLWAFAAVALGGVF